MKSLHLFNHRFQRIHRSFKQIRSNVWSLTFQPPPHSRPYLQSPNSYAPLDYKKPSPPHPTSSSSQHCPTCLKKIEEGSIRNSWTNLKVLGWLGARLACGYRSGNVPMEWKLQVLQYCLKTKNVLLRKNGTSLYCGGLHKWVSRNWHGEHNILWERCEEDLTRCKLQCLMFRLLIIVNAILLICVNSLWPDCTLLTLNNWYWNLAKIMTVFVPLRTSWL